MVARFAAEARGRHSVLVVAAGMHNDRQHLRLILLRMIYRVGWKPSI